VSIAIDSGDGARTQAVYNFVRARQPRCFAVKGQSQPGKPIIGRPTLQDVNFRGSTIKSGIQLWPIGSDTGKSTIYSRLQLTDGPGVYHWPLGTDSEYFMQLTAEKQVTRYSKGFPVSEWVKTRPRNEALDCEIYAYAAAIRAGLARMNFDDIEQQLSQQINQPPTNPSAASIQQPQRKAPTIARSKWMNR
jgi:terminase, large subunit